MSKYDMPGLTAIRLAPSLYERTSTPFTAITLSSFSDGPLGRFAPISHFCTVEVLVFKTAANTA